MNFTHLLALKSELESKTFLSDEEQGLLNEIKYLESCGLNLQNINESLGMSKKRVCPTCKSLY